MAAETPHPGKRSDAIMQVHVSPYSRITISGSNAFQNYMKVKAVGRHASLYRRLLYLVLVLAFLLPFIFIAPAILTLEDAINCSKHDCPRRKWTPRFSHLDGSLGNSQVRTLLIEAANQGLSGGMKVPISYSELIDEIQTHHLDAKTAVVKLKGMVDQLDKQAKTAKFQESVYRHFASSGIPKSLFCLSLKLTLEYTSNARARRELPSPEFVSYLTDSSLHHYILPSDNVLAASVVVQSTIKNAAEPGKVCFHIVTDKNTYAAMHAWFALNLLPPAIVEVKGVHQFDWLLTNHGSGFKGIRFPTEIQLWSPEQISDFVPFMHHLHIFLPELFPELKKVILLDDDVVVQRDLSQLWDIDLQGKVNGAVDTCAAVTTLVEPKTFRNYFNFSHPLIAQSLNPNECTWAIGVNIFDLARWRQTNITEIYSQWLKQNIESNFTLWKPGRLPPALISFYGHVHPIDPFWHMPGLGHQSNIEVSSARNVSIIHYSGQAKPWLEIADQRLQPLWATHVDYSNKFLQECNIFYV